MADSVCHAPPKFLVTLQTEILSIETRFSQTNIFSQIIHFRVSFSVCFPGQRNTSIADTTLKGNNLLRREQIISLRADRLEKGGKKYKKKKNTKKK